MTGFDVATQFGQGEENLYCDMRFSGRDRVGHDGGGQARMTGAQCARQELCRP